MIKRGDREIGIILVDLNVWCKDLDSDDERVIAQATRKYLEDTNRSRGGKLAARGFKKNLRSEKLQYIVHFANWKSTERVLNHCDLSFQLNERQIILAVTLCPSSLLEFVNENISSFADLSSSDSSDIEVIARDEGNGFTFVDIAESRKRVEMFANSPIQNFYIYNLMCVSQFARSVVVKNVPNDLYHPLLLLLENEQRGGGELSFCERNTIANQVLATFKDAKVAEVFLRMKELKILDHIVSISDPSIFEEQAWETDRMLNDLSYTALYDPTLHSDFLVSNTIENNLRAGLKYLQLKHEDSYNGYFQYDYGKKVNTYKEFPKNDTLLEDHEERDIEGKINFKSKGLVEENDTRIKDGLIAWEKIKEESDFHMIASVDEIDKSQFTVITNSLQGCSADDNESNPNASELEMPYSLLISGVTASYVDAAELYLESPKKGGDLIRQQRFNESKEEFEVTFDKEEGKTFHVHMGAKANLSERRKPNEELNLNDKCPLKSSGIIEVHDVMSQEIAQLIVGLLENPRKGGGPIEYESFCEDKGILMLKFKDKATAEHLLCKEAVKILGEVYPICSSKSYMLNNDLNKAEMVSKDDLNTTKLEIEPVIVQRLISSKNEKEFSKTKEGGCIQELSSELKNCSNTEPQIVIQQNIESKLVEKKVSDKTDCEEAAIYVSRIPPNLSESTLYMIFESKRYGGGDIKYFFFEQLHQEALIVFQDALVAKDLAAKEILIFKDAKMLISRPSRAIDKACFSPSPFSMSISREMAEHSVKVSNIPLDINEETLQMIFESKRFGGDDLENLAFSKENRTAVVTFKDPAVALNLLSKHSLSFNGNKLLITKPSIGTSAELNLQCLRCGHKGKIKKSILQETNQAVLVSKILPSINEETLSMIFENRRYGGGNIEQLKYDSMNGIALIIFEDPNVAATLIDKAVLKIKGMQLQLSKCDDKHLLHCVDCASQLQCSESASFIDFNSLKVSGIPLSVSKDMISMYFENRDRSGGGSLKFLTFQQRKGIAVIQFDMASDAQNVLKRKHFIQGAALEVLALELPLDDVKGCAVEVKFSGKKFTKSLLELYFENKSRSGGGQLEDVFLDVCSDYAVIVFQKVEDALGVMQKQPHVLDNVALKVTVLDPLPPPPLLVEEADEMKLLAEQLPSSVTMESLRNYLNRATMAEMVGWIKDDKSSSALLEFSVPVVPDYVFIRKLVSSRPFQGKMISICRVPYTSSILVTEVPTTAQDILIAMHFENESALFASDVDNECKVKMIPEKRCAIVTFKTHKVIQGILSQPHYIEKKLVKVQPYYQWLGIKSELLGLVNNDDSKTQCMSSQTLAFDLKALHYIGAQLWLQTEIEVALKKVDCTVEWPATGKQEVKVNFLGISDMSAHWNLDSKKILMKYIDQLTWKRLIICKDIWTELCTEIIANDQAFPIEIAFDSDACEIQYMGLDRCTSEFENFLSKAETKLNRKRKDVTEIITNFKQFQVALLDSSFMQKQLKRDFNEVLFLIKEAEVHLYGAPEVVKMTKLFLFEKMSSILERSFEVSLVKTKVYAKSSVSLYLKEQLSKNDISASWFCMDNIVKVFAFDDSSLANAVELFQREVVERHMELKKDDLLLINLPSWKEFIISLCTDHNSLDIVFMSPLLVVACTSNSAEEVFGRLNKYIDDHALVNRFLPMDCGVVNIISQNLFAQFQQIENNLQECRILIDDNPGFEMKGNKVQIDKAASDLHQLAEDIVVYRLIETPGVPVFLHDSQAKEVLDGIQLKHKVFIQLNSLTNQTEVLSRSSGYQFEVAPGKFIYVRSGDITKCNTDAIVNAANEELKHFGGVAAAIAGAAGPDLEEDSCTRVKLQGKLMPGEACITRAGRLPCKRVIHAVGPRWKGGHAGEEKILLAAISSALKITHEEGLQSIAIPLISTGIFGYPLDKAADVIVESIRQYFLIDQTTMVREVFIIDNDIHATNCIEKKLRAIAAQHPSEYVNCNQQTEIFNESENSQNRIQACSVECVQSSILIDLDPQAKLKIDGRLSKTAAAERMEHKLDFDHHVEPSNFGRVILSIYALSEKTLKDVLKDIDDIINDYTIDKVHDSPHDQETIDKLSHKPAQWEYEDRNVFEKYPDDINAIVEKAFRERREFAEWEEEHAKYRLNFKAMVEEFMTKPGTLPVKVRRVIKEIDVFCNWETMMAEEIYKRVLLSPDDNEYKDVVKAAMASSKDCLSTIVKVERIENKMLYRQYLAQKNAMDISNPTFQNEKTLWHGTSSDTLSSINHTGFNRSYCGKNAVAYGRGVYFAKHFNYSAQSEYSPPDGNGIKHVYQSKVLTGEYAVGKQNLIVPPLKPGSSTLRYDSTVDNDICPTVFVIFYDTQAYPEYLISFK